MLSNRSVVKVSVVISLLCWIALLGVDLIVLFGAINNINPAIPTYVPKLLLNAFLISIFLFFKFSIGKAESVNFVDLLWRTFVVGLLTSVVSLSIRFLLFALAGNKISQNPLLIEFFYHINIGLVATLLLSTFIV